MLENAELTKYREHLYRTHKLPAHCARCWKTFADAKALIEHTRCPEPCTLINQPEMQGINMEQDTKLRSRKRGRGSKQKLEPNMSEAEKWRQMYKIIFPDTEEDMIPPACKCSEILATPF
jgi:hypothetical protein